MAQAIVKEDGALVCSKCLRVMGQLQDGALIVGNITFWNEARYSCACGRSYYYAEQLPNEGKGFDAAHGIGRLERKDNLPKSKEVVYETLNSLGLENKHYARGKRKKGL